MKFYLFPILLVQFALPVFSQIKKPPMAIAEEGVADGDISQACALLDEKAISVNIDGQRVMVYEAGTNGRLSALDPSVESKKEYVYEAGYRLTRVAYKPGQARVFLTLSPILPDKMEIVKALKMLRRNVEVSSGTLRPACMLGYKVSFREKGVEVNSSGGKPVDEVLSPSLAFDSPEDATEAYENLSSGLEDLRFSYAFSLVNSKEAGINAETKDIVKSQAFRDFVSPVVGKEITVMHARFVTAELIRDTKVGAFTEDLNNPFLDKVFSDMWKMWLGNKERVISFEDIAKGAGAALNLVDVEKDKRYATDEIRHIAQDAERMTNHEWCLKYHDKFRHDIDRSKANNYNHKGGFSIVKMFSGSQNFNFDRKSRLIDQIEKVIDSEDCGKEAFKSSFHYEFDGVRYEPKGIIAHEVSTAISQASLHFTFNGRAYSRSIALRSFDLRYQP